MKRNVFESKKMYLIVISEALLFAVNRFTFVSYLLSLSGGLDG